MTPQPQVYTINPKSNLDLDRVAAEIRCQTGTVAVIDAEDKSATVEQGDTFVPAPGFVSITSLRGAVVEVIFADELEGRQEPGYANSAPVGDPPEASADEVPQEGEPTGDSSAGNDKSETERDVGSGPYKNRTEEQLRALASDRDITGRSSMSRDELEAALRA